MKRPTVTEWVMTLVPAVLTAAIVLVMGGPWWAAFAFGTVTAEVRQAVLRLQEAFATKPDPVADALLAISKGVRR